MFDRLLNLSKSQHLFLFGARGTGKSTLLKSSLKPEETLILDLLSSQLESRFLRNPDSLREIVHALPDKVNTVVIDEIQKVPRLLDVVHALIEEKRKRFVLTGSSARKLKRGSANLLAGRAFVYHLFPLSILEVGTQFNLLETLQFGQLPKLFELNNSQDKTEFLMAYAHTYIKEEIFSEQFVKLLDPFRRFIEVAAQSNGKIINVANIAKDVGVDDKTVKSYFSILEDTLIGFMLEPFQNSFRKRLSQKPKFYFFDLGVTRALSYMLTVPLTPRTKAFGDAFEHFIILECIKLASYFRLMYRFSYVHTKDDAEIDLIVERPGKPLLCIEIKSSEIVNEEDLRSLIYLTRDLPNSEAVCFCNEPMKRKIGDVTVVPWREGLVEYFKTT
ncbi:MAG: AAA family ATPase [Myxococcaceae bacterium]